MLSFFSQCFHSLAITFAPFAKMFIHFIGMAHIIAVGNPFKIDGTIVQLVVINVIYLCFFKWFWLEKTCGDEFMDGKIFSSFLSHLLKSNPQISFSWPFCKRKFAEMFRTPISFPFGILKITGKSSYSAMIRDFIEFFKFWNWFPYFIHSGILPYKQLDRGYHA